MAHRVIRKTRSRSRSGAPAPEPVFSHGTQACATGLSGRTLSGGKGASRTTVLGVDPGLDRTGYAVVQMPSGQVLDAGLVRSTLDRSLSQRLGEIDAGLEEVLGDYHVDLVAVEDLYSHYKHPRTAILMGHARGVVLLAAARHAVEVVSLPATRVKKTLTGNGHASKAQIQRAIMASFGLREPPQPADVADALAVALCAALADARVKVAH